MELNESVLTKSGGSWKDIPEEIKTDEDDRRKRDHVLDVLSSEARFYGFKDSRTLLLFDFWIERIGSYRLVGTIRDPISVARSLTSRQPELSIGRGIQLWKDYNWRLWDLCSRYGFPVINFDSSEEDYRRDVARLTRHLYLDQNEAEQEQFYDEALKHQQSDLVIEDREAHELQRRLVEYSRASLAEL